MDKRKSIKFIAVLLLWIFWTPCLFANSSKIGLALSGGGTRCLTQIGVLQVIDSLQIPIDIISGTSMGAIIGGLYSCGYSGKEIEKIVSQLDWNKLFTESISRQNYYGRKKRWKNFTRLSLDLTDNFFPVFPNGILKGSHITNKMFELTFPAHDIRDFNNLPIPFFCKATSLYRHNSVILDKGYLHLALRASMSIPSFFSPMEIDSLTLLDGGILDNFPTKDLVKKNANTIIGVKVSLPIAKESNENLFSILNKTVTLALNSNVKESEKYATILIYPQVKKQMTFLGLNNLKDLVELGKREALKHLDELQKLSDPQKFALLQQKKKDFLTKKDSFAVTTIRIVGNYYLDEKTILSLSKLKASQLKNRYDISNLCNEIFTSGFFEYSYPILNKDTLTIVVEEKLRQKIGFYAKVNDYTMFSIGSLLQVDNRLLPNSNLLINGEIGKKEEFDFDFVKNFGNRGDSWGTYLRAFACYKNQPLYIYDAESFEKTEEKDKEEIEVTLGSGMFTNKSTIVEGYYFYSRSKFTDNVSQKLENSSFSTNGLGIKVYYEYLDDSYMPMDGESILSKYHISNKKVGSETDYQKFSFKYKKILPIVEDRFSVKLRLEYGNLSTNSTIAKEHDPFYLGGLDNFLGFRTNSILTPVYKTVYLGIRWKFKNKLFWDFGGNFVDLRNKDYLNIFDSKYSTYKRGLGTSFTYYHPLFFSRVGVAMDDEKNKTLYFTFGHDFDSFEFSKK